MDATPSIDQTASPYQLVLLYTFEDGTARDSSGFDNHGAVLGPTLVRGHSGNALLFDGVDDRVVARPSPSFELLGGVRVVVAARLTAGGRRRTLVEGYLAFSLVVESDGRLNGGIYTGNYWHGLSGPAGVVEPGRWFVAEFYYDGRDTFLLTLDGKLVAQRVQNAGAVESVSWPFGLSVGAWPDGDRRCFLGEIETVQIWRAS